MSDITLRLVKGSPLTNQEVDDNFANLNTDKYESGDSASFQDLTLDGMSGPLTWNVDEGTLDVPLNAQVTLQAGQEFVFYAKATEAINNGDVVMFAGAQGGHLLIAKCDMGAVGFDPSHIVGVATQSFAINDFGYVTSSGKVRGIDTSGFTEGTILYVDPTTAGGYTSTKPTPPNHIVQIAAVTRSHATQGTILTRVSHMPDTDEVPEGSTNLYFTDARAVSAIKADGDWNATNWNTAYGWGDHDGLYLPIDAVTLPDQTGHDGQFLTTNGTTADWATVDTSLGDTAYGWGDHSTEGYLTSFTETDPTVPSHVKSITTTNISNWNTAYGWGDHSTQNYAVTTGDTFTGDLDFGDNVKAKFGASDDLQIYHDGSHSYIDEQGTGRLYINSGNGVWFANSDGSEISAKLNVDSACEFRYDNAIKLTTTSTGVDVTGTVTATGGNSTNWNTAYGWGDHSTQSYATQTYVNNAVSNLVDSAPSTLDTLNELAAALGDDPNFAATVSGSIGTKWTQDNTKISNWDTAYSWGNHASAGYLTEIPSPITKDLVIGGSVQASWGRPKIGNYDIGWGAHPSIGSDGGSAGQLIMLANPHIPYRTDNARVGASGRAGIRCGVNATQSSWWDIGLTGDQFEIYRSASASQLMTLDNIGNLQARTFKSTIADTTPLGTPFSNVFKGDGTYRTAYFDGNANNCSVWWGVGNNPHGAIDTVDGRMEYWVNTGSTWTKTFESTNAGVNITTGAFSISGTTVIDSSRNLTNVGTASLSGAITAQGYIDGTTNIIDSSGSLGVKNTSNSTGKGLSLYNGAQSGIPTYGIAFAGTGTYGTHGGVTSDWATYFTMNNTTNRGWIFKRGTTNVASIDGSGDANFNDITSRGKLYFNKNGQTGYHSVIDIDHIENNLWAMVFQSSTVGNDNESGFWIGNNGYPDMRLRRENGTVRARISSWEQSFVSNGFNVSAGDLQVGGTTVIDSNKNGIFQGLTAGGGPNTVRLFTNTADSRVLKLRDRSNNTGNIIQFEEYNGDNTWEVVGRKSGTYPFYIYKNWGNGSGYKLTIDQNGHGKWYSGDFDVRTGNLRVGNTTNSINGYQVNGTAVIDSSRNLTNIGTVTASGLIKGSQLASSYWITKTLTGSGIGSSYDERVVLLCPKVETNTAHANIVDGKITALKTGGNVCDTFDVFCHSVWNDTRATFTSRGQRNGHKLVVFNYDGIKWIGIKFNFTANPYNYFLFQGQAYTNVSGNNGHQLKVISYYDSNTGVLNSEIYNSLVNYNGNGINHKTVASTHYFSDMVGTSNYATMNSDGIDIQSGALNISSSTGNITFANSGTTKRGVYGTMGDNDQWFIGGGASSSNVGYLEISTGDDGQTAGGGEEILVRQYGPGTPLTGSLVRTLKLLDTNGNTLIPQQLNMGGNVHMERAGYITFYGDNSTQHSICSRNTTGAASDDIRINSYGSIILNLDSNNNQTSTADFRIGKHGSGAGNVDTVFRLSGESGKINMYDHSGLSSFTYIDFNNDTGATVYGRIYRNYSSLIYSTSSDYRLKENVVDLTNASARVKQLPVKRFNFIEYPDRTVDGFIAHEVQDIVPEAVVGEYNEVDENGDPVYQGIDQSKLVPLLTAGLQEALAEIENLKQRLDALEN